MYFRKSTPSCQQVRCARNRRPVSHSSTEAEIISLDAGLRMGGLDLWYLVIKMFHYSKNHSSKTKDSWAQGDLLHHTTSSKRTKNQTKAPTTHDSSDLFHVDNMLSNTKFLSPMLCCTCLRDNEAVIKKIIKGSSPTMRHVSRTHRVALDSTWAPRFKSGTLAPTTRLHTH